MTSIDERIVRMEFDNAAFQRGVADTLRSLQMLNRGLQMPGATKGLANIGAAAASQAQSLKNVEASANSLASRFSNLGTIATGALMSIGARASEAATQMLNSFTFGPIMQGFREYETNMNSIQTILANTGLEGKKGLKTVTDALDELNHYSDQTIYNFSEMAKNIGTFTAAGVDLDTSTAAIKGIANLAAVSGSNSEQASRAMYQLSQGIAAGTLTLEDWNSVVEAGMGGKVFQDALVETASVHGKNVKQMIKDEGSFRLTLQKGWLTGEILTETLSKFTGDLTAAQLKTMGYNEKQIQGILKMGKTAQDAATKVKTASQLINTLQEGLGSGWAKTWQTIFGDFHEARNLFTSVGTVLGGFVDKSNDARNKVLGDWKELGGRTVLIEGIGNAFKALMSVLTPIKDAFRDIFPAMTGKRLYDLTVQFRNFTKNLTLSSETADKVRRIFAGVFAVIGIGRDIVFGILRVLFDLVGVTAEGSGGILDFAASIGDFLVALRKGIQEGEGFQHIFKGIATVLAIPIKLLQALGRLLSSVFKDNDAEKMAKGVEGVASSLSPLSSLGEVLSVIWDKVLDIFENIGDAAQAIWAKVEPITSAIGDAFSTMFEGVSFDELMSLLNTGLFAGLVLLVKRFVGGGSGGLGDIVESISDGFQALTGSLTAMQNTLRATTLLQIALAVGILTLSMNTLSKIDQEGLTRGTAAITAMMVQLLGAMLIFEKISGFKGFLKMPFVAASMILLGVAVNVLALALKQLSGLDWNELSKGLTGTTVLVAALVGAMKFMPKTSGMISAGLGMILLATAIKILASAAEDISDLNWEEMAKGLVGVGALLAGLTLFSKFSGANKGGLASGAGIVLLAAGIKILASALEDFSGFSWGEMARGLVAMAGAMAIVTAALYVIPPSAAVASAGVLIVALSLGKIADALAKMAEMSWGDIGKSLTAMLGALTIIAAALYVIPPTAAAGALGILVTALSLHQVAVVLKEMAEMGWEEIGKAMTVLAGSLILIAAAVTIMTGAVPGAAAILIVAAALTVLTPVLLTFSEMSWGEMIKGLTMLAGVFVVLGAAGLLLTPVVPTLIALGVAVSLLGVGILAVGAGVYLFATALTALAAAGTGAAAALVLIVTSMIGLLPKVAQEIGNAVVAFAKVIANAGPAIFKAMTTVILSIVKAINKVAPQIVSTLVMLVVLMANTLADNVPKLVDAGMRIVVGFLNGVAANIGDVVDAAVRVILAFLAGIARNLPRIADAGAKVIITFVHSVADAIRANAGPLGEAGADLGLAIAEGMARGIMGGLGKVLGAASSIAGSALSGAKGILGINSPSKEFIKIGKWVVEGFRKGLDGNRSKIDQSLDALRDKLRSLSRNSAADIDRLEDKLKRLRGARHKNVKAINATVKALSMARKEHAAAARARHVLNVHLDDDIRRLRTYEKKYAALTERIRKANDVLRNARQVRDDYLRSVRDQYSDQQAITEEMTVDSYTADLKKQIEDTKVFSNTLARLRAMGLSDEMYKDLIAAGTSALPFAQELLERGKKDIKALKELGRELNDAGFSLGKTASQELYQAAVDSAKGIVDGLYKQRAKIEKIMDKIARSMVKAIKDRLKIKSPSKVFAEVGKFSGQGLGKGLEATMPMIAKSAENVGDTAVDTLRKSLSDLSTVGTSSLDLRPAITPVLDLSTVKKEAGKIGGILGGNAVSVDSAYAKARAISDAKMSSQEIITQETGKPSVTQNFTQNNYSPKALSSADIYRQTKSQISTAKGALSTSANQG